MFKVKKEKCDQCLFSEDKIVTNSRRKNIIQNCLQSDTHFICHKSSIEGGSACCRGFYETESTNLMRISQRLGMIEEVA